jgi:hypothetical protein
MPQDGYIAARVEPELAEAFSLACKLSDTTVSAALRNFMREYVAAATRPLQGNGRAPAASESAPDNRSTFSTAHLGGAEREG